MEETKCAVCQSAQARYRCPGCETRTCSLACVKRHKTENECDGKRNRTDYVAVKDFTDMNLLSDYRFLEDTGRKAEVAVRDTANYKDYQKYGRKRLTDECKNRNIDLLSMPLHMSRRKENQSHFRKSGGFIMWNVHWLFPQAEAKYTDLSPDTSSLRDLLKKYLHPTESDPVIRHKLRVYAGPGIDNVKLFMKVDGRKANEIRYHELDKDKTLDENLRNKSLIEHPIIHCVLCYCCQGYDTLQEGEASDLTTFRSVVLPQPNPEEQDDSPNAKRRKFNKRRHWWHKRQKAEGSKAANGTAGTEGGDKQT